MEENKFYTEEEINVDVERLKKATEDLEKLAELQKKVEELKK